MKYENLIQRSNREFKRLTGVTPVLFHEMLQVTTEAESRKVKSGRPHTLGLADQLLLTLSYLRHYHTQLELAAIYGLSESNVCRTIRKTQNRHRAHQQEAEDIQNLVAALPQQAETVRVKGKSDCRTG